MVWLGMAHKIRTPRFSPGRGGVRPIEATIHYTAMGLEAVETARVFKRRKMRNASYHFVVGRDGQVVQLVDTDNTAWHAGGPNSIPAYENRHIPRDTNRMSVGIALCNRGFMNIASFALSSLSSCDVVRLRHPVSGRMRIWETYTCDQIESLCALIGELSSSHELSFMTGHEDHVRAKSDPGPAFDWHWVHRLTGVDVLRRDWKAESWGFLAPDASRCTDRVGGP